MSNELLGPAILTARDFLSKIHSQVASILETLDGQMAGWKPSNKKNVSSGIGPQLNPENWLVSYLYRFYFPNESSHDRTIGLIILLDPPDGFSEPVCLGLAAQFGEEQTHDSIFGSWANSHPTFVALRDFTSIRPLIPAAYKSLLPNATNVSGVVIPLCSLTSADDLRTRLVEPLFAAQGGFLNMAVENRTQ